MIIKRKVIPNRLADTPQGVYYRLPYYMQARLQYIGADFMALLRHEAFIRAAPSSSSVPDIFYGFTADKEYTARLDGKERKRKGRGKEKRKGKRNDQIESRVYHL